MMNENTPKKKRIIRLAPCPEYDVATYHEPLPLATLQEWAEVFANSLK